MAVMMPRENWSDERLDDLNKKVDDGFARADKKMDAGFARVDKKMDEGFARVDKKMDDGFARVDKKMDDGFVRVDKDFRELRGEMNGRFTSIEARFDSLNRTLIGAAAAIVAALLGIIATQL